MKNKNALTLASIVVAGMLASGCSQQMASQQAVEDIVTPEIVSPPPAPLPPPVVDCSQCERPAPVPAPVYRPAPVPAPRPSADKWAHTHPAIPGCTDSVTHSHPYTDRNHKHRYNCRRPVPQQYTPKPRYAPRPMPAPVQQPVIVMPKVKAKGTYRGPVQYDPSLMQNYQQ
ncbi:MAG: hypothetical protein KDI15_01575 [Thiothrix sp.]|nr:hypothetical protein [Thiothrix sp.]